MPSKVAVRHKSIRDEICYVVSRGLELSIGTTLKEKCDTESPSFLSNQELEDASRTFEMQMGEGWTEKVTNEDLLEFLNLGVLVNILNRQRTDIRDVKRAEIEAVRNLIKNSEHIKIRNRISHPLRGALPGDETRLMNYGHLYPLEAPNMTWAHLTEALQRAQEIQRSATSLDDPSNFLFPNEHFEVRNNLPRADYEYDTGGFIGRKQEQRELKDFIEHHPVVTVLGVGGMGKTALALRVCDEIRKDPEFELDSIVWVTLKTQYLTSSGINDILDSVNDVEGLTDELFSHIDASNRSNKRRLDEIHELLKERSVLLVIDNLETLGDDVEIRNLVNSVSRRDSASKLLLTSRRGIGESERRYNITGLSIKDAKHLMRQFGRNKGYIAVANASDQELSEYCRKLYCNPLLIKWFVHAIGKGAAPQEILSHASKSNEEALSFCFDNVYEGLSLDARRVVGILLVADRALSRAQIQDISRLPGDRYQDAISELELSNIVEASQVKGSNAYHIAIGSLVFDYLRKYPADDDIHDLTRAKLSTWSSELDNLAFMGVTSRPAVRYDDATVHASSMDEIVMKPYLVSALELIRRVRNGKSRAEEAVQENLQSAKRYLDYVAQIIPNWWEYHRVYANYLRAADRRKYEIERAYKDAVEYNEYDDLLDISEYRLAQYLVDENFQKTDHDEALKHINSGLTRSKSLEYDFLVLKARCLLLMQDRLQEAIDVYAQVWSKFPSIMNKRAKRVVGTQYADALRRRAEQISNSGGNTRKAWDAGIAAGRILDEVVSICDWDPTAARVGVQILGEMVLLLDRYEDSENSLRSYSEKWDASHNFAEMCKRDDKARNQFMRILELSHILPKTFASIFSDHKNYKGRISRIGDKFGFITCADFEKTLYFDRKMLENPDDWDHLLEKFEVTFMIDGSASRGPSQGKDVSPKVLRVKWEAPEGYMYTGIITDLATDLTPPSGSIKGIDPPIPYDSVYLNTSSLVDRQLWSELKEGQRVRFSIVPTRANPRAVDLTIE